MKPLFPIGARTKRAGKKERFDAHAEELFADSDLQKCQELPRGPLRGGVADGGRGSRPDGVGRTEAASTGDAAPVARPVVEKARGRPGRTFGVDARHAVFGQRSTGEKSIWRKTQ